MGEIVVGQLGMRTHTITDGSNVNPLLDLHGLPPSLAVGVLGVTE